MSLEDLKPAVEKLISQKNLDINHRLTEVCDLLQTKVDTYDWVGFYFKNGDKRELILKAFAGEPTDHTIIPFGKGICGQVAESNQNFVVDDVAAQDNYIACSINVKSEVVIPLFVNGENIGQIDIDSHTKQAFSKEDEDFLTWVNDQVSQQLEA
ncbi:GAF domain-containing protein [Psychroflexus sp. CAK8W]|uniref:GAF domain-containing protein n=1 Tax=Psychroflexus longus TaxID=2873596 RepID=A0ABS7XIT1_9FLAO|nr:GAF domain-containing protein [Psychroflexus longus]MBZ9778006.1 GAF domain-containing protein [Psychroflexus longus]